LKDHFSNGTETRYTRYTSSLSPNPKQLWSDTVIDRPANMRCRNAPKERTA